MPPPPTKETVDHYLHYDAETGVFTWIRTRSSNKRHRIGKVAGTYNPKGYRVIKVGDHLYHAHKLAWLIHYGHFPDGQVDHINGIKDDNRIENLRLAEPWQNQSNRGKQSNNSSGYKGVAWDKSRKKWVAILGHKNKIINLGRFADIEDARRAYEAAALQYHGEFARID